MEEDSDISRYFGCFIVAFGEFDSVVLTPRHGIVAVNSIFSKYQGKLTVSVIVKL
jgi:hypothetical protein